jgi:Phage tail protein
VFQGSSVAQYEANRKLLVSALAVRRDVNGTPQPIRCSFTTVGGSQLFFDGYLSKKPVFDWDEIKWGKFLIQLYVPDAALLSGTMVTSPALTITVSGGTVLPWTLPVTLGPSSGGSMTVTNNGNGTALPIVRYVGPLTNPQVLNNNSGLYMKLNYTVPSGSYVEVDMAEKLMLLNGTSLIASAKSDGSDWWGLDPGATLIRLLTDSSGDGGYIELDYYHSYAGI